MEMTEFQEKTMSNSRYILELSFPNVQISLPNKSFYEKLHNRYSNIKYFYHPIHYQFLVMFVKLVCCESKAVLFARINNDLLLWEPTAPSPVETVENMPYGGGLSVASQLISTYSKDSFSQFRSLGPEGKHCFAATLLYNFYLIHSIPSNFAV